MKNFTVIADKLTKTYVNILIKKEDENGNIQNLRMALSNSEIDRETLTKLLTVEYLAQDVLDKILKIWGKRPKVKPIALEFPGELNGVARAKNIRKHYISEMCGKSISWGFHSDVKGRGKLRYHITATKWNDMQLLLDSIRNGTNEVLWSDDNATLPEVYTAEEFIQLHKEMVAWRAKMQLTRDILKEYIDSLKDEEKIWNVGWDTNAIAHVQAGVPGWTMPGMNTTEQVWLIEDNNEILHDIEIDHTPAANQRIKRMAKRRITQGIVFDCGKGLNHYSLTERRQADMNAQMQLIREGQTEVLWRDEGRVMQEIYSAEEFTLLHTAAQIFILQCRLHSDGLEEVVSDLNNHDKIRSVKWGAKLPAKIQKTVEKQLDVMFPQLKAVDLKPVLAEQVPELPDITSLR